ncbi:MAG: hypothetical protein CFE24_12755 [Flavobacterium sp. BFFFF2]|nr:MAG: hypothetical protein CFE24_12755 [Flavobacterium sp. BFFFF2]
MKLLHCWPKENEPKERAFLARIKGHFCLRVRRPFCFLFIAFHKTFCCTIDVFLLFHDFVHFLCWPKENEPKERAFLARINVIFAFGKTSFQAEIFSKASKILPA